MTWAAITIALAVATLLTALRAASLWWKASKGERRLIEFMAGSVSHVEQIEEEAQDAASLNAQAALWSGATALLSAFTTVFGAIRAFF